MRLSIALAFGVGNIIANVVFLVLPSTIAASGQPNAAAFRIARMLGQHVGQEGLRRRARRIQDLMHTVGPLAGLAATAAGSVYAGIEGRHGLVRRQSSPSCHFPARERYRYAEI